MRQIIVDAVFDPRADVREPTRSADFIKRQKAAGKPFFAWVNFTHMHLRTHTKPESIG